MTLVDLVGLVTFVGVIAYAVFAGADFGTGVWDLTAGSAKKGGAPRRLIDNSIGPVWEANHVWLIFVLVFLWSAFPSGFGPLMRTLYVPLSLACLGIVLRGAGFAFRKFAGDVRQAKLYGAVFASSSLITPFFLGAIAGAVASGRIPAEGTGDRWTSWLSLTSIVGGVLAVTTCAFLAAVFLAADAQRLGRNDLAGYFRQRALLSGVVTGGVAIVGIVPIAIDAPTLFDGLTHWGLPFVVFSALGGSATLWLVRARSLQLARITAVIAVASVVAGWGTGQYPWFLVDEMKLEEAAGASSTLVGLLIAFLVAAVTVVPSLVYLFHLANEGSVGAEH